MTTTIEAKFRIATRMFCGGADPEGPAELRLPSFKGALRFWWRALAWAKYRGDLAEIKKREDALLGSADGGQARVVLRLVRCDVRSSKPANVAKGRLYLAGMGLADRHGAFARQAVGDGGAFTIEARIRETNGDLAVELREALVALGLLGGIGSRSRRGFGSLVLQSLEGKEDAWDTLDGLSDKLCDLLEYAASGPDGLPPYTAFSRRTRFVVVQGNSGSDLFEQFGREFLRYRAWGYNGKVLGAESERNFADDHDAMDGNHKKPGAQPRRAVFGLPHNYQFRSTGRKVDVTPAEHERRASPLFFHLNGPTLGVVAFLPATFLPNGEQVRITSKETEKPFDLPVPSDDVLWRPVDAFLDRLLGRNGVKPCVEKFAKLAEVRP